MLWCRSLLSVPFPFTCPYWFLCIRLLSRCAWTLFKLCDSLKYKRSAWATQNTRHICWIIMFWAQLRELALGYCRAWHLIINNGNRKSCLDDTSVAEIHKHIDLCTQSQQRKWCQIQNSLTAWNFNPHHFVLMFLISPFQKTSFQIGLINSDQNFRQYETNHCVDKTLCTQ